ncbi:MAG: hydroxymethylbilane synthase, partial [Verrucomicrobiota bacterium]
MPDPDKPFVIGTRGSDLALCQARMVRAALARAFPDLAVETKIIKTTGDQRTDIKLSDFARESIVVKG